MLGSYLENVPILDVQLLRDLTALCQEELNSVLLHLLHNGQIDDGCLQIGIPDAPAVMLALRIGRTEFEAKIVRELMVGFGLDCLKSSHLVSVFRFNTDKTFNLCILDYCKQLPPIAKGSLGLFLINHDCDPEYFLRLQDVKLDCLEPENRASTIQTYGKHRNSSVLLVKCALALNKSEEFVADLIDQLEAFVFDLHGLFPFMLLKCTSDNLTRKIFSQPFYLEASDDFYCSTAPLLRSVRKGFRKLSAQTIFMMYSQGLKEAQSFESFLLFIVGLAPSW